MAVITWRMVVPEPMPTWVKSGRKCSRTARLAALRFAASTLAMVNGGIRLGKSGVAKILQAVEEIYCSAPQGDTN